MSEVPDIYLWMLAVIAAIAAAGVLVAAVKAIRFERFWAGWQAGRRSLHQDQTHTEPAGYRAAPTPTGRHLT